MIKRGEYLASQSCSLNEKLREGNFPVKINNELAVKNAQKVTSEEITCDSEARLFFVLMGLAISFLILRRVPD